MNYFYLNTSHLELLEGTILTGLPEIQLRQIGDYEFWGSKRALGLNEDLSVSHCTYSLRNTWATI